MQDLLGRLTALDPDASETLKVVSYFDTLIARAVGVESMLRGAAVLSGATVGQRDARQIIRVRADGVRIDPIDPGDRWMLRESGPEAVAWIEREGDPHTNDAMILERLTLALGILRARRAGDAGAPWNWRSASSRARGSASRHWRGSGFRSFRLSLIHI